MEGLEEKVEEAVEVGKEELEEEGGTGLTGREEVEEGWV